MADSVAGALRERTTARSILGWVVVAAVLWLVADGSPVRVGTSILTGAVFGATELLADVYDLRNALRQLGVGVVGLVSAAALALFGDPHLVVPLVLGVLGTWILLDAVQVLRHEGIREDDAETDGREVYRQYVRSEVHDALRSAPQTRRELRTNLDADDAVVDEAVGDLLAEGTIVRDGSELRLRPSSSPGALVRVRAGVRRVGRRLARPVTIEFDEAPLASS